MDIRFQLADVAVTVSAPPEVGNCFEPYFGLAAHVTQSEGELSFEVTVRDGCFILSSGRSEISPEIAASALWLEIQLRVQDRLKDWLQLSGLSIDNLETRLFVIGEDAAILRLLAVEAIAAGLDVSSGAGIAIRDGVTLPHAVPIHVMARDMRKLDPSGRGFPVFASFHDEMGELRYHITPLSFGRPWLIRPLPVSEIIALEWNEGGETRIGAVERHWKLERILGAAHIPAELGIPRRMALMARAKLMADTIPMRLLHAGRLQHVPAILAGHLSGRSQPGA